MVGYWIQRHDYSSETQSDASLGETKAAYKNFDWNSELALYRDGVDGKDCPPGIGINNGKPLGQKGSVLLHICPYDASNAFFNFHFPKRKTMLGIFRYSSQEIHYVPKYPRDRVLSLIEAFYATSYDQILAVE